MTKEAVILVLSCLGLVQAIFLCIYLLSLKKGNRTANILLALLLVGLSIRIGKSVLNVYLDLSPGQRNLGLSGILLVGPALWAYGRLLFTRSKKLNSAFYLHFMLFGGFALFSSAIPNDGTTIAHIIYLLVFLHLALYLLGSAKFLFKHRTTKKSAIWKWFRNLCLGVFMIWLFYMGNLVGVIPYYIGGAIFFSLLVYLFSFLLLKKPEFALEKYINSSLDRADSKRYLAALKSLFAKEASYLNSDLNMATVANQLGIAPRALSQVINENEKQNFSEFVNGYRIEKAKVLLIEPKYSTEKIATIAYDCGFGNVTSFNLAFKAATGVTPSQFRNNHSST